MENYTPRQPLTSEEVVTERPITSLEIITEKTAATVYVHSEGSEPSRHLIPSDATVKVTKIHLDPDDHCHITIQTY